MKSSKKITVQVEDYKGNMIDLTGFLSLKLNIHGNWIGYVGKERVENFSCAFDAASWICEGKDVQEFMTKHSMH